MLIEGFSWNLNLRMSAVQPWDSLNVSFLNFFILINTVLCCIVFYRDTAVRCRAACKKDENCNYFTFHNYRGQVGPVMWITKFTALYHFGVYFMFYFINATTRYCARQCTVTAIYHTSAIYQAKCYKLPSCSLAVANHCPLSNICASGIQCKDSNGLLYTVYNSCLVVQFSCPGSKECGCPALEPNPTDSTSTTAYATWRYRIHLPEEWGGGVMPFSWPYLNPQVWKLFSKQ